MITQRLAVVIWTLSISVASATVRAESNGTIGWGNVAKLETSNWGWSEGRSQSSAPSDVATAEVILASMKMADNGQRTQLLDAIDSDADLFHSLLGRIQDKSGDWIEIEQSIQTASDDRELKLYYQNRKELPDTLANHWWMARWCMGNRLPDQARAHLERVLFFNADHAPARRALGYVAMGRDWKSPEEVRQFQFRAETAQQSMRRYGRQVHQIATRLNSSSVRVVENAIENLASIDDPLAGPAIESVLANHSLMGAQHSLRWFGRVDNIETSQTLCRFALFHPGPDIRQHATASLTERPLHEFVPELLDMLASKLDASIIPIFDRNGLFIGVRKTFVQEDLDTQRVTTVNELMVGEGQATIRLAGQGSNRQANSEDVLNNAFAAADNQDVQQMALARARIETQASLQSIAQQNRIQQLRNEKISYLLSQIAGIEFAGSSEKMWRWWDDVNEVELQESKYVQSSTFQLDSSNITYQSLVERQSVRSPLNRRSGECFIAGTPVVTQRGLRPIESIVPGDLVLNRDLQTGVLQWKPVLQATNRSPSETLVISIGSERLQCTHGHLFWVSGHGWKKASELKKGDLLHGAAEPQQIIKIQDGQRRKTHNLKVADNANYFVGNQRILTHDVTMRKPNRQPIPGYDLAVSLKNR